MNQYISLKRSSYSYHMDLKGFYHGFIGGVNHLGNTKF